MLGIPGSDAGDVSDIVAGVDAYYMFNDSDAFIQLGSTAGFRNYIIDIDGVDDALFVPLAGAARIKILGLLRGGVDVGYAVGVTDGLDGGCYFRPVVGLIKLLNILEVNLSYETVTDAATWSNINVGALIKF